MTGTQAASSDSARLTLPANLATRLATLVAMMSGAAAVGMTFTAMPPILPQLAEHFGGGGKGEVISQITMTMPGIGLALGGTAAAWLIGRLGGRLLLLSALLLYGLAGSVGLFADHVVTLYVSRLLVGFSAANVMTCCNFFIGEFFADQRRGRMISAATAVGGTLATLATLASGAMGEAGGWREPFLLYPLAATPLFLLALTLPKGEVPAAAPDEARERVLPLLWPIYLLVAALYVVLMMTSTQMSFLLRANGITSPQVIGNIISMAYGFLIVGAVLYGVVQGKLGARRTFEVGLLLLALGIGPLGFVEGAWAAGVCAALKGLGSGMLNAGFIHMVLNAAPAHLRGRAIGLMLTAQYLGDFANPIVVAPIRFLFGIHGAFIAFGAALLVGLAWSLLRRRQPAAA